MQLTGITSDEMLGGTEKRGRKFGRNSSSTPEGRAAATEIVAAGYPAAVAETVAAFDDAEIPFGLIVALVAHICRNCSEGAVLIFLPGWDDITKCTDLLAALPEAASLRLYVPLHTFRAV